MAGETPITIIGNLTADPEIRFTPNGHAVANFTVASTPRTYDRQTGEWRDGEAMFLRCSAWRQLAENVTQSLSKGARVIVSGRLRQRSFDDRDGNKRTVIEVDVDEVAASLRYATAEVARVQRQGQGQGQSAADPWDEAPASSMPAQSPAGAYGGQPSSQPADEPPF